MDSMHRISLESPPTKMGGVMLEAALEGLSVILVDLWQELHPLVDDLLSLVNHNKRESRAHV